jgi:hypothetical protein
MQPKGVHLIDGQKSKLRCQHNVTLEEGVCRGCCQLSLDQKVAGLVPLVGGFLRSGGA